jgi:parallel beta-helix repeat protein
MKMVKADLLAIPKAKVLGLIMALALIVSMVPVLTTPQSVSAVTGMGITGLPFTADTSGETYYLSQDLVCSDPDAAGITIAADGVTIDGQGHKITGSVTAASCDWASESAPCTASGVYNAGYDDVVIKNLELESFCTGIALHGTGQDKVERNTVDNCTIHDNGFDVTGLDDSEMVTQGIHACHITGLRITNNDIYNNEGTGCACGDGGNGVFIYAGSPEGKHEDAIIDGNRLHHNAKAGFWTKMMLSYSEITNNEVYGNGYGAGISDDVRGGIILRCKLSDDNLISGNNVHDNDVDGIFIGGYRNTIENNTSVDNARYGINIGRSDGSCDNVINENTVCGNGDGDIVVDSSVTGNSGDNNTCDSTGNYDDDGTTGCTYPCEAAEPGGPGEPTVPQKSDDSGEPGEHTPQEPDGVPPGQCGGVGVEFLGLMAAVSGVALFRRHKE